MTETSDMPSEWTSSPRSLKDKLEALKPDRRAAVEAEAHRLHVEYRLQVQSIDTKR